VAAGSFIADQVDTRVLAYIIGAWTIFNAS
jgi:hypothetical protein